MLECERRAGKRAPGFDARRSVRERDVEPELEEAESRNEEPKETEPSHARRPICHRIGVG